MNHLTSQERKKAKAFMLNMVAATHKKTGGHCGFRLVELQELLTELEAEGKIVKRPGVQGSLYTLKTKK